MIHGSVVIWGNGKIGGHRSCVKLEIQGNVQEVISVAGAFAAVKSGGSVVTVVIGKETRS